MPQTRIERINELARKKKEEGLTPEETAEQQQLYKEYLRDFRANFTGILDQTVIQRPDGSKEPLKKKK